MGVDSTALLLRWLHDADSRDFGLDQLIVITAMTGVEFRDTQRLVTTHILQRLRHARIRFVQIARAGQLREEGITVLDDSRAPTKLFIEGVHRLSEELLSVGTVPQFANGQRRCSQKYKGWPLDTWIRGELQEQPFRHVIGYNADELDRVKRDRGYSNEVRHSEYPLVEWGWERTACECYIQQITGETWTKSCCTFCPFTRAQEHILTRYRQYPDKAAHALFLEHVFLCLNSRMTLYAGRSLRSVSEAVGHTEALGLFQATLNAAAWATYRVRRIFWAKGRADRCIERIDRGNRDGKVEAVLKEGGSLNADIARLYRVCRSGSFPTREEMLVAAPAVVGKKSRPSFAKNWARIPDQRTLWNQA